MKISLTTVTLAILLIVSACTSSRKSTASGPESASPGKLSASRNYARLDSRTFKLTAISEDTTYGYTAKNPINVGGALKQEGPSNEQRFLNALLGPNGETITYERQGSCCAFDTKNGFMGGGLLDRYEVKWEGQDKPVILFINMYDAGDLKAPKGFTFRQ